METIEISKVEYEKMLEELERLREAKEIDWDLVKQFDEGLEDLKAGRIKRVVDTP